MESLWIAIVLILAVGFFFVLLPVALTSFYSYGGKKTVTCPETGGKAEIELDAGRAARNSLLGRLRLRVDACSLWPEKSGCAQDCLRAVAAGVPFQA